MLAQLPCAHLHSQAQPSALPETWHPRHEGLGHSFLVRRHTCARARAMGDGRWAGGGHCGSVDACERGISVLRHQDQPGETGEGAEPAVVPCGPMYRCVVDHQLQICPSLGMRGPAEVGLLRGTVQGDGRRGFSPGLWSLALVLTTAGRGNGEWCCGP